MKKADLDRLKSIENSTRDLYKSHGDDIEAGRFIRMAPRVIQENKWLCEKIRAMMLTARARKVEEEEEDEAEEEAAEPEVAGKKA